jgi:trimethylamine--corrinoid protein Co-methyltransferase
LLGAIAGGELFGHAGICGTDHGASLEWLVVDDEAMAYVKRVTRGFEISPETLAADVVHTVGPAGNYLAEAHTVSHYRRELWTPNPVWTRQDYDTWNAHNHSRIEDRARQRAQHLLTHHRVEPLDESLCRELDRIVDCAQAELGEDPE